MLMTLAYGCFGRRTNDPSVKLTMQVVNTSFNIKTADENLSQAQMLTENVLKFSSLRYVWFSDFLLALSPEVTATGDQMKCLE